MDKPKSIFPDWHPASGKKTGKKSDKKDDKKADDTSANDQIA